MVTDLHGSRKKFFNDLVNKGPTRMREVKKYKLVGCQHRFLFLGSKFENFAFPYAYSWPAMISLARTPLRTRNQTVRPPHGPGSKLVQPIPGCNSLSNEHVLQCFFFRILARGPGSYHWRPDPFQKMDQIRSQPFLPAEKYFFRVSEQLIETKSVISHASTAHLP